MDDIDTRLAALEGRLSVEAGPPELGAAAGGRRRKAVALIAAPILVLVVGATAVAGPTVYGLLVRGAPGIENPGQPLYGARLECMTPRQAEAYLRDRGYTDVVWQIEVTDKAPGAAAPAQVSSPPDHGYVVPGAVFDGRLHMVIDQRPGATGTGACAGMPMP